jgi:hypothetical protein
MKRPKDEPIENPFASSPAILLPAYAYKGRRHDPHLWFRAVPCSFTLGWYALVARDDRRWHNPAAFSPAGLLCMMQLAGIDPVALIWDRLRLVREPWTANPFSDDPLAPKRTGKALVYFIQCERGGPVKIGMAVHPPSRLRELQLACPYPSVRTGCTASGSSRPRSCWRRSGRIPSRPSRSRRRLRRRRGG